MPFQVNTLFHTAICPLAIPGTGQFRPLRMGGWWTSDAVAAWALMFSNSGAGVSDTVGIVLRALSVDRSIASVCDTPAQLGGQATARTRPRAPFALNRAGVRKILYELLSEFGFEGRAKT